MIYPWYQIAHFILIDVTHLLLAVGFIVLASRIDVRIILHRNKLNK